MSNQLQNHPSIHLWEPMILALIPDDETTKELVKEFNSDILPPSADLNRFGRLVAMTAIYINAYLRSELIPDFADKPSGKDEIDFVHWLSLSYGVPINIEEI